MLGADVLIYAMTIARAALAISVEIIVIARAVLTMEVVLIASAEVNVWGHAWPSSCRYIQRTHVDIVITSHKCDAL